MSDLPEKPDVPEELPRARVKRRGWSLPVVWVVPMVAAIVAGYVVYDRVRELGPRITIRFKNGSGLRAGQTSIKYRGVPIGDVTAVELSEDQQDVLVTARLRRTAASIAREGAVFWIVRPEAGLSNIAALGTVITGPEIQALPGTGGARSEFVGLDGSPVAVEGKGVKIVLVSTRARSLIPGSPVYYRGVEVGVVQDLQLRANATAVNIAVFIKQQYANLVRKGSKFWNVSGLDVNIGFFRGMEVNMESLRSLAIGGIAFATPNDPRDGPVKDGMVFLLHDTPNKEWLQWAPKIPIQPGEGDRDRLGKG